VLLEINSAACYRLLWPTSLLGKAVILPVRLNFALVLSGGIGNLIDRIGNEGRVIDFMNLGIGSWRTGVFNVADIVILGGGIWLFAQVMKKPQQETVL
jgi:signal peptidase II